MKTDRKPFYISPELCFTSAQLQSGAISQKMARNVLAFTPTVSMAMQSPSPNRWHCAAATTALSAMLLTAPAMLHDSAALAASLPSTSAPALTTSVTTEAPTQQNIYNKVVQEAWRVINSYYIDAAFNGVDWPKLGENLARVNFESENYAYETLRRTIRMLNDKYTRVLTSKQMQILNKYDVSGVGLLLTEDMSGNLVVATEPEQSSPAGKAGIHQGDAVLFIDGNNVEKASAFNVAQLMQGDDGTAMTVTFRDRGQVELVRNFTKDDAERAVRRSVVVDRADGRMGYIRLSDFVASSRLEVARALRDLRDQHADWIVLDLRGNTGGVFEDALEIAGLFEGDGVPMVNVHGRNMSQRANTKSIAVEPNGEFRELYSSRFIKDSTTKNGLQDPWSDVDVAIVMDGRSASSSEVLASGLRESCRATLVGNHSFGKGLIQGVFGLPDGGGVIVTVAEYKTPSGKKIHNTGLDPDLKLNPSILDSALHALGINRISEDTITVSHDEVRHVLQMCKTKQS